MRMSCKNRLAGHPTGGKMEVGAKLSQEQAATGKVYPRIIIQCEICKSLKFCSLIYEVVEALLCDGSVSRYCQVCGKETMCRRLELRPRRSSLNAA